MGSGGAWRTLAAGPTPNGRHFWMCPSHGNMTEIGGISLNKRHALLLAMAVGILISGCGLTHNQRSHKIPVSFWHNIDRLVRDTGFPHTPGVKAHCSIPVGGLHLTTLVAVGTCSTEVRAPSTTDLRIVPKRLRATAALTVVLSESWPPHSATFTYVITRKGSVLGTGVSGQPPQGWKTVTHSF